MVVSRSFFVHILPFLPLVSNHQGRVSLRKIRNVQVKTVCISRAFNSPFNLGVSHLALSVSLVSRVVLFESSVDSEQSPDVEKTMVVGKTVTRMFVRAGIRVQRIKVERCNRRITAIKVIVILDLVISSFDLRATKLHAFDRRTASIEI